MLSTPKRKAIFIILAAVILAAAVFLGWILAGNSTSTEEGTPSYSTEAVDWNEELEGDEPELSHSTDWLPALPRLTYSAGRPSASAAPSISLAACSAVTTRSSVMQLRRTIRAASCSRIPEVDPQRSSMTEQSARSL